MNSNSTQQQTHKIYKKEYGSPKPTGNCCFCSSNYCCYGNNPYPLSDNPNYRCCDECNKQVLLARFGMLKQQKLLKEKRDEEGKTEEDAEPDDKGILCRFNETDGWYPIEPYCVSCGHKPDVCNCGNFVEGDFVKTEPKKVKQKMVVVEYQLSEKFKIPAGIDLNDKKTVVSWGVKWNKMTIQLVGGEELEVGSEGWTTDFDFKRPSSIGEIEDDDEDDDEEC